MKNCSAGWRDPQEPRPESSQLPALTSPNPPPDRSLVWAGSDPPTQAEVPALADKLDELINTLSA